MGKAVIIVGSPSKGSRLTGLVRYAEDRLAGRGVSIETVHVVDLPAEDLLKANFGNPRIQEALALVNQAEAVIIASPVYKASYSGLLKTFLDLLPQEGLKGKLVLPLFIGGTIAHLLSIDYALKPVVAALGGRHVLGGVYAVDQWVERLDGGDFALTDELTRRLDLSLDEFIDELEWKRARAKESVIR